MQLGALAVVIRQTNIVWMLFVACTGVINITLARPRDIIEVNDVDIAIKKPNRSTSNDSVTLGSNLRRRKFSSSLDTDRHSMPSATFFSANHPSGLLVFNSCNCVMLWKLICQINSQFSLSNGRWACQYGSLPNWFFLSHHVYLLFSILMIQ